MSVKVIDNSKAVLRSYKEQVNRGLKAVGMVAEGYAKQDCPYDTGRLQNSITNEVQKKNVYIGTNVEYAVYVEFGDQHHAHGKNHFLKDAAANHGEEYKDILKASLSD